ncbi:hypothetical protein VTN00DRAFT_4740 [Thermoascus crustaceus]|uniref:uncharacterized protein n=1 Tax=Thermoascus crustaceus TaxID=5088 RepID=UPI00374482D1
MRLHSHSSELFLSGPHFPSSHILRTRYHSHPALYPRDIQAQILFGIRHLPKKKSHPVFKSIRFDTTSADRFRDRFEEQHGLPIGLTIVIVEGMGIVEAKSIREGRTLACQQQSSAASKVERPCYRTSKLSTVRSIAESAPRIRALCRDVPQRIERLYQSEDGRRWKRLESCPFWTYADLISIFTDWDSTWEAASKTLHQRSKFLYDNNRTQPLLDQTLQIHKDTGATIDIRERMRLHRFSVDCFIKRLENILMQLNYYELTSLTLLDQQRNLHSLTLNTETVTQTQAVNRITVIGFVFVPIPMQSIFQIGMVTLHWYPLAAVPTLIFTVLAAVLANKLIPLWKKRASSDKIERKQSTTLLV